MSVTVDTVPKYVAADRFYVFDFQYFPEITPGGETISVAANGVTSATAGLTIGTPEITTQVEYPGTGGDETAAPVPKGKGVIVRISGGVAGTSYTLTCVVTKSGGGTLVVKGVLAVE